MDFEISAAQVKSMLKRGEKFVLLDVREPWECEKASLEGSKQIPMGEIPARANQELDPEEHIVVLCHHGVFAQRHQLAAATGIRESAIGAWWNRRLGPHRGSEGALVLRSDQPSAISFQ